MENRLLNENFIRQRCGELQIPFENLLAASILEEIVHRIAGSKYARCFWMKKSINLNLDSYRKKVDLSLSFSIKDGNDFQYKKEDISNLFAELFPEDQTDAVHWNYNVCMDRGMIDIDMTAAFSSVKVPVKIKLEPVSEKKLTPYVKNIQLFLNNNQIIQVLCFPSEYVVTEKFLEILEKLELLNDMSCYMEIYEILKEEALSGRKVWEFLQEGCEERNIPVEEKRFDLFLSYRTSRYMQKKWKAYLYRTKRKQPGWNEVMDLIVCFFKVIWEYMCRNVVYLGDWMPELGRCMD